MSEAVTHEPTFDQLQIDPRIVAAVTKLGFNEPTPIQAKAIPPLLAGHDLIGRARTGSGKTAAFGLPLLDKLSRGGTGVRALVLAPTRELAQQITAALQSYSNELQLKMVTLYGGSAYQPQLAALRRGVDVVVGTPGRLRDHLERGSLDLSAAQLVVIDEADEMLRMGFVEDLTQILQATPNTRQVALFSATMPAPIREVAQTYLREPLEVHVERGRLAVEHIEQYRIDAPDSHKVEALVRVLKSKDPGATLIFARTRLGCNELAESLRDRGFNAQALHGDMSQAAREEVLAALRTRRVQLVVATDVAARGIDVEHLTHVINFDMPEEVEVYVNRIGRTGRAGRKGIAISLVTRRDQWLLRRIEQRIKATLPARPVPSDAQIVGRQRAELETALQRTLEHPVKDSASALAEQLQQGEWTDKSLATAAIGLLMRDRHLDIETAPSDQPPQWARPLERKPASARSGASGRPRFARDRSTADETTVSAAVGREHGIGPSDVVGALANELGVPPRSVGRITIHDRRLTVGLAAEAAAHLARNTKVIYLRGEPVTFTRTPGAADRGQPYRGKRPPPSRGPRGGSGAPTRSRHPSAPSGPGDAGGRPSRGKAAKNKVHKGRQAPVRKGKGKGNKKPGAK